MNYPIVILHGWNLNAEKFKPLEEELEKRGYQVFCFDLPGFGQSNIPDKPLTLSDYVSYIENFLKKKKIPKIILIGHSFGGRISIKFAAKNPGLLKALILTGAPGLNPVPKIKILFFLILSKVGNWLFSIPLLSYFKNIARAFLYKAAKATDFYNSHPSMRQTFKNIVLEELSQYLRQIKTPTLLIWGEEDQIVPIGIAQKMNKLIKKSQLVIIPNARHGVPWTNSKEFTNKVEVFLNEYE